MSENDPDSPIREVTLEEATERIEYLWQDGDEDEILSTTEETELSRFDFSTLKVKEWLNDKIIDAYMSLIMQRSAHTSNLPKVYIFSTQFYTALEAWSYPDVSEWTKDVAIFSYDILLVPIHIDSHWTLIVFNQSKNTISYLDSLATSDVIDRKATAKRYIKWFTKYLMEESKDKLGVPYHNRNSRVIEYRNVPTQHNNYDCGVFICAYAENITREGFKNFMFKQGDIRYLRRKMCFELGEHHLFESSKMKW